MLLQNALTVSFEPFFISKNDIRILNDSIVEIAENLKPIANEEVLNLSGHIVMPGMVCSHHHLYSALARGMPSPKKSPNNFVEVLEEVWWKLDRGLDKKSVEYSALVGAIDAVKSGTTCIIDHHASPSYIKGSLSTMADALEKVGVKSVLCYEVTDRNGKAGMQEGIDEHDEFLSSINKRTMTKALIGGHASFTLSDEALEKCSALMKKHNVGFHVHVCEDGADDVASIKDFGMPAVKRYEKFGCINSKSIFAHGIHLSDDAREIVNKHGAWIVHNPTSNMNNNVGYSDMRKISKLALGTDGMWGDMFLESRAAFLKARDAGSASAFSDAIRAIMGSYKLASEIFGKQLGGLTKGSPADLIVLDYKSPTPLTKDNFWGHFLFGMSSRFVKHTMIAGKIIVKDREVVTVNENEVYSESNPAAKELWDLMGKM